MNEKQRFAWLRANRITMLVVGWVWIGMIVTRFITGDTPWFLIAMAPAFALTRFLAYFHYQRER
jgi:hypothetical protein